MSDTNEEMPLTFSFTFKLGLVIKMRGVFISLNLSSNGVGDIEACMYGQVFNDSGRIANHHRIRGNIFNNNRSGTNDYVITDVNRSDNTYIASNVNIISDHRALIVITTITDRSRLTKRAVLANPYTFIYYNRLSMKDAESRPCIQSPWQFSSQNPLDKKLIKNKVREENNLPPGSGGDERSGAK